MVASIRAVNVPEQDKASKAGGTPYRTDGKEKTLCELLAELFDCPYSFFQQDLKPLFMPFKIEVDDTLDTWLNKMTVDHSSPYFTSEQQELHIGLPMFPGTPTVTVTEKRIDIDTDQNNTLSPDAALAMAAMACANPHMKEHGVTVEGDEREQLLLALALQIHGIEVKDAPAFDENNPDHAAVYNELMNALPGYAEKMAAAEALGMDTSQQDEKSPDQSQEDKAPESEAKAPHPAINAAGDDSQTPKTTLSPALLSALEEEYSKDHMRPATPEILEKYWQDKDEDQQEAFLKAHDIEANNIYDSAPAAQDDDCAWDNLSAEMRDMLLAGTRQNEGHENDSEDDVKTQWNAAPYENRKASVEYFKAQQEAQKTINGFCYDETPEDLKKIRTLDKKLHPDLRIALRMDQDQAEPGSADHLGYFDVEALWQNKSEEEQKTFLEQMANLEGQAYYDVPQDEAAWDKLPATAQQAFADMLTQGYDIKIPLEAAEAQWNIYQDENQRQSLHAMLQMQTTEAPEQEQEQEHSAADTVPEESTGPKAQEMPAPAAPSAPDEKTSERAENKHDPDINEARDFAMQSYPPAEIEANDQSLAELLTDQLQKDSAAQTAHNEQNHDSESETNDDLPEDLKEIFERHSAPITAEDYEHYKNLVITRADQNAHNGKNRNITRSQLAKDAGIGSRKISAVFEALQKEGIIDYDEGERIPRRVTVKPAGKNDQAAP